MKPRERVKSRCVRVCAGGGWWAPLGRPHTALQLGASTGDHGWVFEGVASLSSSRRWRRARVYSPCASRRSSGACPESPVLSRRLVSLFPPVRLSPERWASLSLQVVPRSRGDGGFCVSRSTCCDSFGIRGSGGLRPKKPDDVGDKGERLTSCKGGGHTRFLYTFV